eukprot:5874604-Pleurochrysis_carterae.AAC.1
MEELLKAKSKASSWCWAVDMVRVRSRRSSSTNSGVRVAALMASSLMRGGSPPVAASERDEYDASCCRERVSARSAFTTSWGEAPS